MTDLFDWAVAEIEAEYERLGHRIGWRFLMSPRRTLRRGASTVLLTLNPGGKVDPVGHPKASHENGSAYVHERWPSDGATGALLPPGRAPLQRQVQDLFAFLGEDPDETLSAYFIPFRSPSLRELTTPRESRAFAKRLWRRLLRELQPRRVVTLGQDAFSAVLEVLGHGFTPFFTPSGWGNVMLGRADYPGTKVYRLPHLSTFKIFSRPCCKAPLELLFERDALETRSK